MADEAALSDTHEIEERFESLVDYLRHLVDKHEVTETPELWRSGRSHFDAMHAEAHSNNVFGPGVRVMPATRGLCPHCGREYSIRADGKFRWHAIRANEPCPGALKSGNRTDG